MSFYFYFYNNRIFIWTIAGHQNGAGSPSNQLGPPLGFADPHDGPSPR